MMIFFTEEDLVSFGNYMVSPLRERMIREHNPFVDEDQILARLQSVSDADLGNWVAYASKDAQTTNDTPEV